MIIQFPVQQRCYFNVNMEDSWDSPRNIVSDRGWSKNAFSGADKITPGKYKTLRQKLLDDGLICTSGGNVYVFLTTVNYWSVLCSHQSMVFINSIMGIDNATVQYGNATTPYVPYIEKECAANIAAEIPQSICIGSERLRVSLTSSGLSLEICEDIVSTSPSKAGIVRALCYMPLHINFWPKTWVRTPKFNMYKFLSPLFSLEVEFKTLEWCLGNAMIDPHSFSKTVILYGPGGHGKGTIMGAVESSFSGCCSSIPEASLVGRDGGIPTSVLTTVASNRIVISGDVGGSNRKTNLTIIKQITGHDFVVIPPSKVKTACTLLYATNQLDDPLDNIEWCTEAIMRRVVVILIDSQIVDDFNDRVPSDAKSRLDFVLRCVHTRLTNHHMPVSAISVLLTIMGDRMNSVSKFLCPGDGGEDEIILSNEIIAAALSITASEVGRLASRITKSCVTSIRGVTYIKGIVPTAEYYHYIGK